MSDLLKDDSFFVSNVNWRSGPSGALSWNERKAVLVGRQSGTECEIIIKRSIRKIVLLPAIFS